MLKRTACCQTAWRLISLLLFRGVGGMGISITQSLQPGGEGADPPLALQPRLHQQSAGALNHKNTQLRRIQKAHPNCTPASGQEQTPELLLTHCLTSQRKPAAAETWLLPWRSSAKQVTEFLSVLKVDPFCYEESLHKPKFAHTQMECREKNRGVLGCSIFQTS